MKKKQLPVGSSEAGPCILGRLDHHWNIATAKGPSSIGRCGKCKKQAVFFNSTQSQIEYENNRKAKKQVLVPAVSEFPERAAA